MKNCTQRFLQQINMGRGVRIKQNLQRVMCLLAVMTGRRMPPLHFCGTIDKTLLTYLSFFILPDNLTYPKDISAFVLLQNTG